MSKTYVTSGKTQEYFERYMNGVEKRNLRRVDSEAWRGSPSRGKMLSERLVKLFEIHSLGGCDEGL